MDKKPLVVVTDRGGHLHNALRLIDQMGARPSAMVTTFGPDIEALKKDFDSVYEVPYLFSWAGKTRWFNPFGAIFHLGVSFRLALKLKPRFVVSVGASNVVPFCYWARLLGAKIFHVECMNQVVSPSITGRFLYPICEELLVQWPELLKCYGAKARYEGWVL